MSNVRTLDQIKREIAQAEKSAEDPNLKGNKLYTSEQQRRLYQFRAEALKVELAAAEKTREAILRVAQS